MCVCIGINLGGLSTEARKCFITKQLSLFTDHRAHLTVAEVGLKQVKRGGKYCF